MVVRRLLLAAALATSLAFGACGEEDLAKLRDEAEQVRKDAEGTLDKIRSGATAKDIERELDKVREELDKSDLPEDAKRELEQTRDDLERAAKELRN